MSLMIEQATARQRGSSLIEVMVALLILAVGLLGFAGMQTRGMQMARKSYSHSQAAFLAEDLVERMRANATAVTAGNYKLAKSSAVPSTTATCTASSPCSPAALASKDLNSWAQMLSTVLPSAQFEVKSAQVGGVNSVTVSITYALNTDVEATRTTTTANAATTIDYVYTLNTEIPLQ
jgi:type IV pilus assembly protein PilV